MVEKETRRQQIRASIQNRNTNYGKPLSERVRVEAKPNTIVPHKSVVGPLQASFTPGIAKDARNRRSMKDTEGQPKRKGKH